MHRPLLTKTTSSRRTSQVTWRKKLHSLIAGLQPAASILAAADHFPAASPHCRAITRATLRGSERDLDGHRQPRHRTPVSHSDIASPTARCSSRAVIQRVSRPS